MSALVFRQMSLREWTGTLLRPSTLIDRENPARPVRAENVGVQITEGPRGCRLRKWGSDERAARITSHASLEEAQRAALRWAGRRFARQ